MNFDSILMVAVLGVVAYGLILSTHVEDQRDDQDTDDILLPALIKSCSVDDNMDEASNQ